MKHYRTKKQATQSDPQYRWIYCDKDSSNTVRWFVSRRLSPIVHNYLSTVGWFTSIEQYRSEYGNTIELPRGILR